MSEYYFSCEGLTVGYNNKPLISDISVGVSRGEILTLIGPNGAGKSTILKSAARQLKPLGGVVYLDGKELSDISRKQLAKEMAVLFTDRIKPEYTTVREMVAAGRYPYTGFFGKLTQEDKRITEQSLESVRALELADRDFNELSDGQRQRVLLARALCQQPEIIILDEPTSFLDIRHKLELLNTLRRLVRERNIAVILSLHELELAQRVSDRIVCVGNSGINRTGTPEEIFKDGFISEFYGLQSGFNENFGCAELERIVGTPEIFVISGGGTGTAVFRRLQRKGIPFAVGIIHENDLDYPTSSALACEVVSAKPFEPITDEHYAHAERIINSCQKVICTINNFGEYNNKNLRLLDYARSQKYLITNDSIL